MNTDEIKNILNEFYRDVTAAHVSAVERKKNKLEGNQSLIYGDTNLQSLHQIMSVVNPIPGEYFYDLGSGGGQVLLDTALNFPFLKFVGIEILENLVALSQAALKLFRAEWSRLKLEMQIPLPEIRFKHGDFTRCDLSPADIVFVAATCFDDKLINELSSRLERQLKPGARVITVTRSLPSKKFHGLKKLYLPMNWGPATVFVHRKSNGK